MTLDLFDGKLCFTAQLADYFFLTFPYNSTKIAVVGLILRQFLKSITGDMKTGATLITVEYLIGIVVKAAEAYFTVSLEKLVIIDIFIIFCRFYEFLALDELLQLRIGFIAEAVFEIFEDGGGHEITSDIFNFLFTVIGDLVIFFDGFY